MVSIPQTSIVAGLLVAIFFAILDGCVRVTYERIELVNLLFDVLGVLLQTLRLFASLLTKFVLIDAPILFT